MAQATISIRIDENVKSDAEMLFNKIGLTLSSAVNVFFRQSIREQGIPFSLTAAEEEAPEMQLDEINEIISEVRRQMRVEKATLDNLNEIIDECKKNIANGDVSEENEQLLALSERLAVSTQSMIDGVPTIPIDEAKRRMEVKFNDYV